MAKDEKIYGAADASQGVPVDTTNPDARVAVTEAEQKAALREAVELAERARIAAFDASAAAEALHVGATSDDAVRLLAAEFRALRLDSEADAARSAVYRVTSDSRQRAIEELQGIYDFLGDRDKESTVTIASVWTAANEGRRRFEDSDPVRHIQTRPNQSEIDRLREKFNVSATRADHAQENPSDAGEDVSPTDKPNLKTETP